MPSIVECIPNFSEGRNPLVINNIKEAIASVDGVMVLHIDAGYAANRTVITFAGDPEAVGEAAFRGVKRAAELIDMSHQEGEHPRIGATDVLPFAPVSGIDMEAIVDLARGVAQKVGTKLGIPVYCYERAASSNERVKLEACRRGEYEGLASKMTDPQWRPDFGATTFDDITKRSGATIIGARNFLIAVNFNLNTTSASDASWIASRVRESGYVIGDKENKSRINGLLKGVKAIGWYIQEYGFAQVSVNITDINSAPLYDVWKSVSDKAAEIGLKVTGTEIIGLVPKVVLIDTGKNFSDSCNEADLVEACSKELNLSQISLFVPDERTIEYMLNYK